MTYIRPHRPRPIYPDGINGPAGTFITVCATCNLDLKWRGPSRGGHFDHLSGADALANRAQIASDALRYTAFLSHQRALREVLDAHA